MRRIAFLVPFVFRVIFVFLVLAAATAFTNPFVSGPVHRSPTHPWPEVLSKPRVLIFCKTNG